MDKETLSNYGWIVILVLILAVMLALATPFGNFIAGAIKATTAGFFSVNQNALNSTGLINIGNQEFESCNHEYEITTTGDCATGTTSTHTCKLCGKSYTETKPVGHKWDDSGLTCTKCGTTVVAYGFKASDYDSKMGTTTATDTNVVIPDTFTYDGTTYKVTYISNYAFRNCSNLTSITIPESVTSIESYAFDNCTNLTSIDIPGSVTSIGKWAFNSCKSLTSITIPDSVTSVGDSAFYYCDSLTNVAIGNSVTNIGESAFGYCKSLTSINIPEGVTSIVFSTFNGCYSLTSITIPDSVTSIGQYAFSGCSKLTSITYKGTTAQWNDMTKGGNWNNNVPATYVQCSDGTVSLS